MQRLEFKIMLVFCLVLTSLFFLPRLLLAKEADSSETKKITLYVAESRRVSLNGTSPFAADADILGVQETLSGQTVLLTGLRVGTTQLYFYQGDALTYRTVEVIPSSFYNPSILQPKFRPGLPYLMYSFANDSLFSHNTFFELPSYSHYLLLTIPTAAGYIGSFGQFAHSVNGYSLSTVGTNINGQTHNLQFGNASASLSQNLSSFSGASLLGTRLLFTSPSSRHTGHEVTFFGGIKPPQDLLDFTFEEQRYGMSYKISRRSRTSSKPMFLNTSLYTYQPVDSTHFNVAGLIEGNVILDQKLSVAAGYGQDSGGGFALRVNPLYLTKRQITLVDYSFTRHGLGGIGALPTDADAHTTQIVSSHLLKNNRTQISYNLFQSSSLPYPSGSSDSSHSLGGSFGISNQLAARQFLGVSYGLFTSISGDTQTLGNSVGTTYTHAAGRSSIFAHNLSYFRSDMDSSGQGASVSNSFEIETDDVLYNSTLSNSFSDSSGFTASVGLSNSIIVNVSKFSVQAGLAYSNPEIGGDQQFILLTPLITASLTTTQALQLAGGLFYDLNKLGELNGSMSLQYQRYLGPGVVSDPLWKTLIGKGKKSNVSGNVFLDKNYNKFLDKNDTPLPNVRLTLDNRRVVTTDAKGYFNFKNVKEGDHVLTIDPKSFEKSTPLAEQPQLITRQTFSTVAQVPLALPIPVTFKRAVLRVQYLLDINDNKRSDTDDTTLSVGKGYLILPDGKKKTFTVQAYGGGILGGIEKGVNTVGVDLLDLPEGIEGLGPNEQKIKVSEYEEYPVNFLFRPIRTIRGQVRFPADYSGSSNLVLILGKVTSTVDKKGYYWLKNLPAGGHTLKIKNLPQKYCLANTVQTQIWVPNTELMLTQDITIQECPLEKKE